MPSQAGSACLFNVGLADCAHFPSSLVDPKPVVSIMCEQFAVMRSAKTSRCFDHQERIANLRLLILAYLE